MIKKVLLKETLLDEKENGSEKSEKNTLDQAISINVFHRFGALSNYLYE